MATLSVDQHRTELEEALRQWQEGARDAARTTLAPGVEAGWLPAIVALIWFQAQDGLYDDAAPLVQRALEEGNALPGLWLVSQFATSPSHTELAGHILRVATETGIPFDPTGYWQALWNAGNREGVVGAFEAVATPQPFGIRAELERLIEQTASNTAEIQSAAAVVNVTRDEAVEAIRDHEAALQEARERVERLVDDTSSLVHGVTADHIAKAYAERAKGALASAGKWTIAAIVVGIAGALWAVAVAIHAFTESQSVSETVGKVLVSLPILVVAGYLASIASNNRRMGWHWSHIELQIRTAEPFIANLDDDTRNRLLAALAIRFFPGQGQDPQQGAASSERLDVGTLISGILHELAPSVSRSPKVSDSPQDSASPS